MRNLLLFLLLGAIFVACSPEKKYANELSEINQFEEKLDSLQSVYLTIKFDSLIAIQKEANYHEKMIKKHYMADTMSIDLVNRLHFIKNVRKSLQNIEIKKASLAKEIGNLRTQFKNLETDILNGILGKEEIDEFLTAEKLAFTNLADQINQVLVNQEKQLKDYGYAIPVVHDYVEIIKPKENQE